MFWDFYWIEAGSTFSVWFFLKLFAGLDAFTGILTLDCFALGAGVFLGDFTAYFNFFGATALALLELLGSSLT